MRAKQENTPRKLVIPLHPPNPFYIVGGAPSSLAAPPRGGVANVLVIYKLSQSLPKFFSF